MLTERPRKGNCYVTCEALYHLLGGKKVGLKPMVMRHEGSTHWFLLKESQGPTHYRFVIDPTAHQFKTKPNYSLARGCGFLTRKPSKRAAKLMEQLIYG